MSHKTHTEPQSHMHAEWHWYSRSYAQIEIDKMTY